MLAYEDWGSPKLWWVMRGVFFLYGEFLLAALDRTRDSDGNITQVDENAVCM